MEELAGLTAHGGTTWRPNQVLYNLTRRGIEYDLLPWCRARGIPLMAYSPLEQGRSRAQDAQAIAARLAPRPRRSRWRGCCGSQASWRFRKLATSSMCARTARALDLQLTPEDLAELDEAFPPPTHKTPLEMI